MHVEPNKDDAIPHIIILSTLYQIILDPPSQWIDQLLGQSRPHF